jgi:hypothetical protein
MHGANLHFYVYFLGVCNHIQGMFAVPFEAVVGVSDIVVEGKMNNVI